MYTQITKVNGSLRRWDVHFLVKSFPSETRGTQNNSYGFIMAGVIIGQVRSSEGKWLVLSHTFTGDTARANPSLLTQGFYSSGKASAERLHVPPPAPGSGELMLSMPPWVWGCGSFIWALSSGVWAGVCHLHLWLFRGQSLALLSPLWWHLWHLAPWDSEEALLSEDALEVVQNELGWGGDSGGSHATLVRPSLMGVMQPGNQCQEMAEPWNTGIN